MKVAIIGANGQLGTALRALYPDAVAVDSDQLDITDREAVDSFDWSGIDVVLNAAAYTNVDGAETPEGRIAAWKVNAGAVGNLLHPAWRHGIRLVHISSDYVFDGTQSPHTEDESFSPLGVYAASKAAGDILAAQLDEHYIIRTSWVIGQGNNFVRTMKSLADKDVKPSVVNDQIGRLTFTTTLAAGIKHLLDNNAPFGTYNLSNEGESVSWADIAKLVYEQSGKSSDDVTPVSTIEYYQGKDAIAPRPLQSTLDLTKIKSAGFTPTNWHTELSSYMQQL